MKRFLFAAVLAIASVAAWALPSPKQIESALAAQDYRSAHSMVDEVLRSQPQSARAHLLNSYLLVHADHNPSAAAQELSLARQLDNKGDVKNSPLFGRTAAEIDMARVAAPAPQTYTPPAPAYVAPPPQVARAAPAPVQQDSGHGFFFYVFWLAILGGCGYGIYYFVTRKSEDDAVMSYGRSGTGSTPPSPPAPQPSYGGYQRTTSASSYAPPPTTVIVQGGNQGMSVAETALVVGGTVLAAEAIANAGRSSDAYERGRRDQAYSSGSNGGYGTSYQGNQWGSSSAPAPAAPVAPTLDYETERQSLSSGSEDSFTPSPAPSPSFSSGRDDSFSSPAPSPSYDSGSPSSDWSSSPSPAPSDSGGGSDW